MKDQVKLPREHYNAIRRVLRMVEGYVAAMPEALHAYDGGMMTTGELWEHLHAARKLMPTQRRRAGRSAGAQRK